MAKAFKKKVGGSACGNARNTNVGRECPITLRSREDLCQLEELESRTRIFRVCEDEKRCRDPTFYDADALAQWVFVDGNETYPHNRTEISASDKSRLRDMDPHVPVSGCSRDGVSRNTRSNTQDAHAGMPEHPFSSMSELRDSEIFDDLLNFTDDDGNRHAETVREWLDWAYQQLSDAGYERAAVHSILKLPTAFLGNFKTNHPTRPWVQVYYDGATSPTGSHPQAYNADTAMPGYWLLYVSDPDLEFVSLSRQDGGGGKAKKSSTTTKVHVPGCGERVVHVRDRKKMVKVHGVWVPLKEALKKPKK